MDVVDSMAVLFILQRIHYQQQTKRNEHMVKDPGLQGVTPGPGEH